MARRGSILVGLLWCLALLSLIVIGVLHTSRIDLMVVRNHGDRIQAYYLALAGIEKAKALLYQDARERSRSRQNHTGQLYDNPQEFRDIPFGRGRFSVFRAAQPDEGSGVVYGIRDEESRLNINTASAEEIGKLHAMTPDVVAALVDWRDTDNTVTSGGAEADYYTSLQPPSQPRNGPILTERELLMVRGVSRQDLFADDPHQTGLIPPALEEGSDIAVSDTGWAGLLTAHSGVENLNAAGQDRIHIQSADETALTGVPGISPEIARTLIAYRDQSRLENLADLLDVAPVQNQNQNAQPNGQTQGIRGGQPSSFQGRSEVTTSGPKVIDENLFLEIADDLTADENGTLRGVVNINTASVDVLICLPGITRELAYAIIAFRKSNGFLANTAWLLRVPGMTSAIFKSLSPRVTARSETFRILSEGMIPSTGVRQRLQAIVHVGLNDTQTLDYREDNL